jgi:hypothetical protein
VTEIAYEVAVSGGHAADGRRQADWLPDRLELAERSSRVGDSMT